MSSAETSLQSLRLKAARSNAASTRGPAGTYLANLARCCVPSPDQWESASLGPAALPSGHGKRRRCDAIRSRHSRGFEVTRSSHLHTCTWAFTRRQWRCSRTQHTKQKLHKEYRTHHTMVVERKTLKLCLEQAVEACRAVRRRGSHIASIADRALLPQIFRYSFLLQAE
jgi:hypothetical protein